MALYHICEILSGFPIFPPKLWENSGTESLWVTVVHTTNASGKHRSNVNGLLTFFMPMWEYVLLACFTLKTWEHLNVQQHCLISCWWAGGLAHMVECSLSMREVPGSMPGSSTFVLFCCCCLIFLCCFFLFDGSHFLGMNGNFQVHLFGAHSYCKWRWHNQNISGGMYGNVVCLNHVYRNLISTCWLGVVSLYECHV